jgi:hypothetical protein
MRLATLAISAALLIEPATAHDFWSNGDPVPEWVKSQCCGVADVHHIHDSAVHIMQDGYHIDGIETVVPIDKALPSPDGQIWGFWSNYAGPKPNIYCFFYPIKSY